MMPRISPASSRSFSQRFRRGLTRAVTGLRPFLGVDTSPSLPKDELQKVARSSETDAFLDAEIRRRECTCAVAEDTAVVSREAL